MPELLYFSTRDETLALIEQVAEKHAVRLVPEVPILEKPGLATFDRLTPEADKLLASYPVLLLEGPFTKHALSFKRRADGSAAGTYYVDDDVGPRLRWYLPGLNAQTLTPGRLTMLDSYRDPETREFSTASAELRDAFKSIGNTIKGGLVKHKLRADATIWIGRQALDGVKTGALTVAR